MEPITCDCGHQSTPDGLATGYAVAPEGATLCYDCAADRERAAILERPRSVAYISGDGKQVVSWSGRVHGSVTYWGKRHAFSRARRYFAAVIQGQTFWGVGAEGMYCTLQKGAK